MPELPEVETVRRVLAQNLEGACIRWVRWLRDDVVVGVAPTLLAARLQGARFRGWGRRGKYLLLVLTPAEVEGPGQGAISAQADVLGWSADGAAGLGQRGWAGSQGPLVLAVHLRMTGRLVLARAAEPLAPHTHAVFLLDGAQPWEELRFVDVRRFGRIYYLDPIQWAPALADAQWTGSRPGPPTARRRNSQSAVAQNPFPRGRPGAVTGGPQGLATLGPEPLGPRFDARFLGARLRGRQAPIKAVLLDQRLAAGLGNIYADEALFAAGIDPGRPAGRLTRREVARLVRAIKGVLRAAIAAGGTTFSDYRDGLGRPGHFASQLAVYGRAGSPCPRCSHPIAARRLGGRTAHYCPRCQR